MTIFANYPQKLSIVVIGASGGIGSALVSIFENSQQVQKCHAITKKHLELNSESSIKEAARNILENDAPDIILVCTGFLHSDAFKPERSLRHLSAEHLQHAFTINTIGPALIIKHFAPFLSKQKKTFFGILSARVGSISDNRLGGWFAYRASKAALNQIIRTASIELKRTHPELCLVGLHPGTVDTRLSQPFQSSLKNGQLFSAEESAQYLLKVIDSLGPQHSGSVYDWAAKVVPP